MQSIETHIIYRIMKLLFFFDKENIFPISYCKLSRRDKMYCTRESHVPYIHTHYIRYLLFEKIV